MNIEDRCEICGEENWAFLATCCRPHGRLVCNSCWRVGQGPPPWSKFKDPCALVWVTDEECIAGLEEILCHL